MDEWYKIYDTYTQTFDINTFKSNTKYTYMLEHVSQSLGIEFFKLLTTKYQVNINTIYNFCSMNDSFGSPVKYKISELMQPVSPSSLRYLYHAFLIVEYMQPNSSIVELGCGYGGLCLAVHFVSKLLKKPVKSYSLIDLDSAIRLQSEYLSKFTLTFPITFHSSTTYGNTITGDDNFLVSAYCFSELGETNRNKYQEVLFSKVQSGFIVWNSIPVYNFGKNIIKEEDEYPKTASANKYIYF